MSCVHGTVFGSVSSPATSSIVIGAAVSARKTTVQMSAVRFMPRSRVALAVVHEVRDRHPRIRQLLQPLHQPEVRLHLGGGEQAFGVGDGHLESDRDEAL